MSTRFIRGSRPGPDSGWFAAGRTMFSKSALARQEVGEARFFVCRGKSCRKRKNEYKAVVEELSGLGAVEEVHGKMSSSLRKRRVEKRACGPR